jgi:hypothetical protein
MCQIWLNEMLRKVIIAKENVSANKLHKMKLVVKWRDVDMQHAWKTMHTKCYLENLVEIIYF